MSEITISTAKTTIRSLIHHQNQSGDHMPLVIMSPPGIGKSSIIKQICDEGGMEFIDLRLAQKESSDINGIPFIQEDNLVMSTPDWFPTEEKIKAGTIKEKGVLFLDEITNASSAVQHAAYELVLDRSIGGCRNLPDGYVVCAAGNGRGDFCKASDMTAALGNRFIHLNITASHVDFLNYAVANELHPSVAGYINFNPSQLMTLDSKNTQIFCTPRSWEMVSNIMKMEGLSFEDKMPLISGTISEGVASEFSSYVALYSDDSFPDLKKVATGEVSVKDIEVKDPQIMTAILSAMVPHLYENHNKPKNLGRLSKLIMKMRPDIRRSLMLPLQSVIKDPSSYGSTRFTQTCSIVEALGDMVKSYKKSLK